jgi:hypothetical protein
MCIPLSFTLLFSDMDALKHDLYDTVARLLYTQHGTRFAWYSNRWWRVIQAEEGPVWVQHGAREELEDTIPALRELLPGHYLLDSVRDSLTSVRVLAHVTAAARTHFRARIGLPAPSDALEPIDAPAPELPAP